MLRFSHEPAPPSPSWQGCSQSVLCPVCICAWIALTHVHNLALGLVELQACQGPFEDS